MENQELDQQLALVEALDLDLYPLAEVKALQKALQKAQELGLVLHSPHLWYRNLEKDWDLLVQFAQELALEKG